MKSAENTLAIALCSGPDQRELPAFPKGAKAEDMKGFIIPPIIDEGDQPMRSVMDEKGSRLVVVKGSKSCRLDIARRSEGRVSECER